MQPAAPPASPEPSPPPPPSPQLPTPSPPPSHTDAMATHAKLRDRSCRRLELEQQLGLPSDHASEAVPAEGLESGGRSELRHVEELPPMPPRQTEKKTSTFSDSDESDGLDALLDA